MAFPFTHLCVAWRVLEARPMAAREAAQFFLGAIAPDAVHYRKEFLAGGQKERIGATKKISHLCPVSDEKWGQVTDNDGWISVVREFLRENSGAFAEGYAVHCLTDLYNNLTLWDNFRTNHPQEAAKGYTSAYYTDLQVAHMRSYLEFPHTAEIMEILSKAKPEGIKGLVSAEETNAIAQNLLHENFKNAAPPKEPYTYRFVSYEDTMAFIDDAARFCVGVL